MPTKPQNLPKKQHQKQNQKLRKPVNPWEKVTCENMKNLSQLKTLHAHLVDQNKNNKTDETTARVLELEQEIAAVEEAESNREKPQTKKKGNR